MTMLTSGPAIGKDGIIEINGIVQSRPVSLVGDWMIAGRTVRTDGATVFKQELGPISVGALVEVKGTQACEHVMGDFSAWTFEDHAFAITPAVSGQCPSGLLAVHRFFNNPTRAEDMNHRFTVTTAAFDATIAMGWAHEGIVMCAHL
jgi:hypothetical protein